MMNEEREQFEAWAKMFGVKPDLTKANGGANYSDSIIDIAWLAWRASRAAQPASPYLKLPELNGELIKILGRPNFTCSWAANVLRKSGMPINRKAEDEQAAVIHFLLGHYLQSGDKWFEAADKELSEMAAAPEVD